MNPHPGWGTPLHDFRLYEPAELGRLGERHGREQALLCTRVDAARPPSADNARYQLVMRRRRP